MSTLRDDEIKALVLTRLARLKAAIQVDAAAQARVAVLKDFEQLLRSKYNEILNGVVGINDRWGEVRIDPNHPVAQELRKGAEEAVRQQFPLEIVRAHTEELLRRPKTQRAVKAIIEEMLDNALQRLIEEEFETTVRQAIRDVLREGS